jgi:CheY-like chemotaxis protein
MGRAAALSAAPSAGGRLIVVADDDAAMRELLVFALGLDGYRVLAVSTGAALLEQVRRIVDHGEHGGVIDLVISDVRMPGMDGVQVLQHLRDLPLHVPFILVTAFSDLWTRAAAERFGAQLLDKPVELRQLRAVVRGRLSLAATA